MSDQYGPPDADPAGNQPTQPLWAGPDAPADAPGWGSPPAPGYPGHQPPGLPGQPKKDHRTALHWTAGVLVAVLLAGGGTIAGMRLASHSSPASGGAAPGQAGPAASLRRDGALLDQTLSDASAPGALTAAGTTLTGGAGAAAGAQAGRPRRRPPAPEHAGSPGPRTGPDCAGWPGGSASVRRTAAGRAAASSRSSCYAGSTASSRCRLPWAPRRWRSSAA